MLLWADEASQQLVAGGHEQRRLIITYQLALNNQGVMEYTGLASKKWFVAWHQEGNCHQSGIKLIAAMS